MTVRVDRYPSRAGGDAALLPRLDPVVHGEGVDGPLDPELVADYEENGFLALPGWINPHTAAAVDAEIDRLAADEAVRSDARAILEPGDDTLRSLFEVHHGDGPIGALARDRRLAGVARQLLGSDVYVHQSRINLKPGFRGKEFYWHSDFETWHTEDGMPAMRALSCSVLLTPNHPWNGPLLVIPGSHRWYGSCPGETPDQNYERSLRAQEVGTPTDQMLEELVRQGDVSHCVGNAGTVVFFDCNLMHGSNGNITPSARRNVFVVYNSVENSLEAPFAAPAPRPEFIASRTFDPV